MSVIDAETIDRRLIENIADLVKFEPGVYIDSNVTRVGLNGFNIRGIGGNRVMTQVDGVETSRAVRLRAVQRPPVRARSRHAEDGRNRAQLRLVALRQRRARRRGLVLHQGSVRLPRPAAPFHIAGKTLYDGRAHDTSGNVVVAGGGGACRRRSSPATARGHEPRNKGTVETEDATRTALNPQDRRGVQALGKVTVIARRAATCCAARSRSRTPTSRHKRSRRAA